MLKRSLTLRRDHRCMKCKMLQKTGMYQPTAFANVTVLGDSGELNVSINNSVLNRYLRNCDLTHLLQDGQDIEEHLLECGSLKLHIQNDNVVAMAKILEETTSTSEECSSESSVSVCAIREAGPVPAAGDLESVCAADEVESVCAADEVESVCAGGAADEARRRVQQLNWSLCAQQVQLRRCVVQLNLSLCA